MFVDTFRWRNEVESVNMHTRINAAQRVEMDGSVGHFGLMFEPKCL